MAIHVGGADCVELLPLCELRMRRHQSEMPSVLYTQAESSDIQKIMLRCIRVEPGGELDHMSASGGQQCGGFMIWWGKLGAVLGAVMRLWWSEAVRASSVAPDGCSVRPARITHMALPLPSLLMHISTACSRR